MARESFSAFLKLITMVSKFGKKCVSLKNLNTLNIRKVIMTPAWVNSCGKNKFNNEGKEMMTSVPSSWFQPSFQYAAIPVFICLHIISPMKKRIVEYPTICKHKCRMPYSSMNMAVTFNMIAMSIILSLRKNLLSAFSIKQSLRILLQSYKKKLIKLYSE